MIIFLIYWLFFLFFQSVSIYGGDAGDLVTAAYVGGIAHPPGYPLYSLLGFIASHIPFGTVAWRVGLLSSTAAAGTLYMVYLIMNRLTRSRLISFISGALLASNYLLWLYGVVPEVFALHLLLISISMYVSVLYYFRPQIKYLYYLVFILALGISHHHLILTMLPSTLFLIIVGSSGISRVTIKNYAYLGAAFFIGLLPYLWVPFRAFKLPIVIWSNPTTFENMIKLITRADYGTFNSGVQIGNQLQSRLLQFSFLYENYLQDFSYIGLIFALLGAVFLYRKHKNLGIYFMLTWLIMGPVYFFYASYLYTSGFLIGTAERFLLPSYLLLGIFEGLGMWYAGSIFYRYLEHRIDSKSAINTIKKPLAYGLVGALGILLVTLNLYINYPKISVLKYDTTAEKFGLDIVGPLEKNSILLLNGDIAIFNTQYVVHALGHRPDIVPIHFSKLLKGDMQDHMKKYYPSVKVPPFSNTLSFGHAFIDQNYGSHAMYSTLQIGNLPPEYTLIPEGLIFKIYKKDEVPPYAVVKKLNNDAWNSYQDPLSGSLGTFRNLMLANVLDYYKAAHIRSAMLASIYGKDYSEATGHIKKALSYDPFNPTILMTLATNQVDIKKCNDASITRDMVLENLENPYQNQQYLTLMIHYSKECQKGKDVTVWQERLKNLLDTESIQLKDL